MIKKIIKLLIIYSLIMGFLYSLCAYFLSQGWNFINPNVSEYAAYFIYYFIPLLIALFVSNIGFIILGKRIFLKSFLSAAILGFIGPLIIHILVISSSHAMAAMAYVANVLYYVFFYLIVFIASSIILLIINKKRLTNQSSGPLTRRR